MNKQRGFIIRGLRQRSQPLQILRLALAATRWVERDHPRPGQRLPGRNVTQYQTVIIREPQWRIENQFGKVIFQQ